MKKRLTFFSAGGDVFLRDIIVSLRNDYNIKIVKSPTVDEFYQAYHDTDIAWIEWCDQLAQNATVSPKLSKLIIRLHSYEMFTDMPGKVDWNKIDKLVFVNPIVRDYCLQKFRIRPDITTVIFNGVDTNKYTIPKEKKYNKKVAYIGYINYKKGPALLLQCFYALWKHDPSFTFHIAGQHQDERIALYFQKMSNELPFHVSFDGWVDDMPKYFEDKDFVISTSLFESFQYSLAEGMSSGVIPLIHSWPGSELLYPDKYVFVSPDECVKIVEQFEKKGAMQKEKERLENREFIQKRYELRDSIEDIKKMIESV